MLRFEVFVALLICFLSQTFAFADPLACYSGCQIPLSYLTFNGTGSDVADDWTLQYCSNEFKLKSMYICLRHNCNTQQIEEGLQDFQNTCTEYGNIEIPPLSLVDDISDQDAMKFRSVERADIEAGEIIDEIVWVSDSLFKLGVKTDNLWYDSERTRALYGYAMYGFWGIVLIIGMLTRLSVLVSDIRSKRMLETGLNSSPFPNTSVGAFSRLTKTYVTVPSLFNNQSTNPIGWCTIPPRLQSLTIFAFILINVVLSCVSYKLFSENLYWASTRTQLSRYLADRTGVLAIANLPLLWVFATRNNILLYLTGWSFETFNQFHRWVARIATLEAIIHAVSYTFEAFQDGGKAEYYADWVERYWWCGAMAVSCMSLITVSSFYPMRHRCYEVFLILHIGFAIIFMAAIWYHVEIFDGEYNPYLYPCFAVWGFDRLLRLLRIVSLNIRLRRATASYNVSSDIIHLSVPCSAAHVCGLKPGPGTFYYLYVMDGWRRWESHPFTLASWTTGQSGESDANLTFLLRPYESFTARLRDKIVHKCSSTSPDSVGNSSSNVEASNPATSSTSMRVVLEGPYGDATNLGSLYDASLLIAGGSGVTVPLAHLRSLFFALSDSEGFAIRLQRVKFIWAIKERQTWQDIWKTEISKWLNELHTRDISQGETTTSVKKVNVDIDVFITRAQPVGREATTAIPTDAVPHKAMAGPALKIVEKEINDAESYPSSPASHTDASSVSAPDGEKFASSSKPSSESAEAYNSLTHPQFSIAPDARKVFQIATPSNHLLTMTVNVHHGRRPVIHNDVVNFASISDGGELGPKRAVLTCGPMDLTLDARRGVVSALSLGDREKPVDLDFFPESFCW